MSEENFKESPEVTEAFRKLEQTEEMFAKKTFKTSPAQIIIIMILLLVVPLVILKILSA